MRDKSQKIQSLEPAKHQVSTGQKKESSNLYSRTVSPNFYHALFDHHN